MYKSYNSIEVCAEVSCNTCRWHSSQRTQHWRHLVGSEGERRWPEQPDRGDHPARLGEQARRWPRRTQGGDRASAQVRQGQWGWEHDRPYDSGERTYPHTLRPAGESPQSEEVYCAEELSFLQVRRRRWHRLWSQREPEKTFKEFKQEETERVDLLLVVFYATLLDTILI